jgi:protein-disulfide isomerase
MSSSKTGKRENKPDELQTPRANSSGRSVILLIISIAGLLISLASGFQDDIPFIGSLCSSACKDTVEIHFLYFPFWLWGALFYFAAAVFAFFRPRAMAWIAAPAAGVEAVLILLMIQLKAPCVFCIANAVVVFLLIAVAFRKELFWQQATLALLFFVALFFWVPLENGLARPGSAPSAPNSDAGSGIAAQIGDEVITNQRLDVLLGAKLFETEKDIYRMKMEKLDQVLTDMVLEKEAKQQGKTPEALAEAIAPAGSMSIDESEVDKYLQDNQQRLQTIQAIPDLRDRIKNFLEQQKRTQAIKNYVYSIEPRYGVHIFVQAPNPPTAKVDTRGAPSLGPSDAPVTVIEFSDYQCPACRSTHLVVNEVRAAYGDKLQWIYKEYPLKRHKEAFKAAEASHCAQDQGKFWEYQEQMFTTPDLSPGNLVNIAVQLGLSREKFAQCLEDSKYKSLVEKNTRDAAQAGIDRTPTFMINGVVHVGTISLDVFKSLIDEELKKVAPQRQTVGKAQ